MALTMDLVRIMLISPVLAGLSGIVMGILNSFEHFLMPALAPVVYNLGIIGGARAAGAGHGSAGTGGGRCRGRRPPPGDPASGAPAALARLPAHPGAATIPACARWAG